MIRRRLLSGLGGVALAALLVGCSSPSDDRNAKSPDDVESERRETVPASGEPAQRSLPAPEVEPDDDDDDGFDPDDEHQGDRPDLPEELPEVLPPERENLPGGRPPSQVPPEILPPEPEPLPEG
jgi:hypothetical protein